MHATLAAMKAEVSLSVGVPRLQETRSQRFFYSVFLPLGAVANLVLGLIALVQMKLDSEFGWLALGTGAFCCMIAGWLAASAWSKSYWNRTMVRQISTWRRIADAFFAWLEDVPLPAESLHRLKSSLDEVVPSSKQG
jgi:hypothetical protein